MLQQEEWCRAKVLRNQNTKTRALLRCPSRLGRAETVTSGAEPESKYNFYKSRTVAAMRNKKRVRYGICRENRPAGFRYVPCQRTARCKCGPVARPVPPLSPISWAFLTCSPSLTLDSERCR